MSEPLVQAKMAHDLSSSGVDEGMGSHPPLLPLHCIWSLQGVLYKPFSFWKQEVCKGDWGPPFDWKAETRVHGILIGPLNMLLLGLHRIMSDEEHVTKFQHMMTNPQVEDTTCDIKASIYPIFHIFNTIITLMLLTFFAFSSCVMQWS